MKKALLVFPDEWLQYSPTMLNMEQCLRGEGYNVDVIYGDNGLFQNQGLVQQGRSVRLMQKGILAKMLRILNWYVCYKYLCFLFTLLKVRVAGNSYELVFAVDLLGYRVTHPFFKKVILLSLELPAENGPFVRYFEKNVPTSIIIQSPERAAYLLRNVNRSQVHVSYIQNAPIFEGVLKKDPCKTKEILYLGNIDRGYSLEPFLDAFYELPEYSLVLKGFGINNNYLDILRSKYDQLFDSGQVKIVLDYIKQEDILQFVSQYYIGLVGYDASLVEKDFNYESSPSGKLFNYYAAGVPVIGLNIIGLNSVEALQTGVLLDEIQTQPFISAVQQIEACYESYVHQCIEAAKQFDFKKGVQQFIKAYTNGELQYA